MVRRLLLAPLLALAFSTAAAGGVRASCAVPPSLPEQIQAAALVFVGTVLSTSDDSRFAYVRVESIWKGPTLAENVRVYGSPVTGSAATSIDRRFQIGTRYLFVLYSANEPFQDNICSATQPYTPALASMAPADAKRPLTVGYATDPMPNRELSELVIVLVALGVVVIATTTFLAARALWLRKR